MSPWATKSIQSFKASNKLIVDELFSASVHSSYYSCVQYMLHILYSHLNFSENEVDNFNNSSSMTFHKLLKKTIYDSLRQLNPDYAIDFNDQIGELCDGRVRADYKSDIILEPEAKDFRQLAHNTLTALKEIY